MPRTKLIIEYDGTDLAGWQRQKDHPSVQQHVEEALEAFCNSPITLHGAGRTDAGVHGLAMAAHADLPERFSPFQVQEAANHFLKPVRISIIGVEPVAEDFHARFSATQRSYRYRILNRRQPPALREGYVWHVPRPLDIAAMQEAASHLLGHHDFTSFRAADCQSKSPMKTLDHLTIREHDDEIWIEAAARSFLYNQVRIMVGTLARIGMGDWQPDDMKEILSACDRTKAGPTAPACGLYFDQVRYD